MREENLMVSTGDGDMPVFAVIPDGDSVCPAVIIYMDIFGPREELFDFCRRFANNGYAALLPQLFYRIGSPAFEPANRPEDTVEPAARIAGVTTVLPMVAADTGALIDALDGNLLGVSVSGIGAIGYCMGGRHALAAAVRYPDRIGCGLSIHGGHLADDTDRSPHLLIQDLRVPFYFAFAKDDATCPDDHQAMIEAEAESNGDLIVCESFEAGHGWSFPTRWRYDPAVAEANWRRAFDMFARYVRPESSS